MTDSELAAGITTLDREWMEAEKHINQFVSIMIRIPDDTSTNKLTRKALAIVILECTHRKAERKRKSQN